MLALREPKLVENAKLCLFVFGSTATQRLRAIFGDLVRLHCHTS